MIRTLCWSFFLFAAASACFGTDLELTAKVENLYWSEKNRDTASGRTFDGKDLFWAVDGSLSQELADGLTFKGGLETDPVLRRRVYSQLGFTLDNMTLRFAPFLAAFNSAKWFNPGMDALVEYRIPGLFFVKGGFLTTFAPVAKKGDYYLSSLTAGVGALMENGILTFSVVDKSATFQLEGLSTVDASTRYWFDLEMFLKNFPLHWAFVTGYQLTDRTYVTDTETSTTIHSLFLGARFSWDFGSGTTAFIEGESVFFQQGWASANVDVPSNVGVFQAVSGVRYHW